MTSEQAIAIKKYCEGVYPSMKRDTELDLVWFDQLKGEEYHGTMQSLKNWIKKGNKFPPSIPELISGYELVINEHHALVLKTMEEDGYFNDPFDTEKEIAEFNKKNRIKKARLYISQGYPKETIPNWFKQDYLKYDEKLKQEYERILRNVELLN